MTASSGDRICGRKKAQHSGGFLSRLAQDTAGNAFMIMGAFAIPLALLAGSAVDMSRAYLVKVRLQQACDAGVLAGRKVMTQTTGTALETAANDAAEAFFKNNFPNKWMGTPEQTDATFAATRTSDGQVAGTASVTLPMTIMKMAGFTESTQTVTCQARLDIGDSDIMFVLDVTGSMACATGAGCSSTSTYTRDSDGTTGYQIVEEANSKISALRSAVKLFRTTLETNKPTASHIRYGFVPYSSSVNVGALVIDNSPAATGKPVNPGNPDFIVNTAVYPSRELADDINSSTLPTGSNSANYDVTGTSVRGKYYEGDMIYAPNNNAVTGVTAALTSTTNNKAGCLAQDIRTTGSGASTVVYPKGTFPTSSTVTLTRKFPVWSSGVCKTYAYTVKPYWRYANVTHDVSKFKTFVNVSDPTKGSGSDPANTVVTPTKWQGCIEERDTTVSTTTSSFNSSSLPKDIDPDFVPNDDATRWRPLWPNVIYYRSTTAATLDANGNSAASADSTATGAGAALTPLLLSSTGGSLGPTTQYYGCSAPAKRLDQYTEAQFNSYLDISDDVGDFRPFGHTYHDVGMIWGLRLISPDGIWKADTAAWPGNNAPNRYIVFMTDGLMDPDPNAYYLYGMNRFQARAAAAGTSDGNLATIHNRRFQAACNAAKAKNITVFVVAFNVGTTVPDDLRTCATEGYSYAAQTNEQLQTAFSTIALEIARLRLSQ
jgi:Flp pilus assembly protein TadG